MLRLDGFVGRTGWTDTTGKVGLGGVVGVVVLACAVLVGHWVRLHRFCYALLQGTLFLCRELFYVLA